MKKALVYYLYGTRNAGDMAICVGAVELLKQKGFSVTMVSRFSEAEDEYRISKEYLQGYYPDVEVYPGPFSFERDFSPIRKLGAYAASCMKVAGVLPDRVNRELIEQHDVVFFNGGNLLRGERTTDYLRLAALFYPIELRYLKGIRKVYIREERSYDQLRSLFPELPLVLSTDLAFFCEDKKEAERRFREEFRELPPGKRTALILRGTGIGDIGQLDGNLSAKMERLLEKYVTGHPSERYWIVVQTKKDREISERFFNRIREKVQVEIIESHDPLVLRELYRRMDLTISMRLHAAILSLSARTPVAGVFSEIWGLKNPGIMSAYGMPYIMAESADAENLDRLIGAIPADVSERIDRQIRAGKEKITLEEG